MKLLLEHKLIYGRLLTVNEPHLVERYRKAMKAFGLKATKLKQFQIDRTGFSPEVAKELGNDDYMDPHGVNRRFIILTPDQSELPVVHTQFSNTDELMYEFFKANERALNVLTIKDVIYGEIEDNVFEVSSIDDLLEIEQVEFKLSTADKLLGKASEMKAMMDRLIKEPEAWRDNELLTKMVEYSKVTGDIRTNELLPDSLVFRHDTFWASHFGGTYVFNDDKDQITVISDPDAKGFKRSRPWQVSYIDIHDADRVFHFLEDTGRMDKPRGSWIERSGLLQARLDMCAIWLAFENNKKFKGHNLSERDLKRWISANWDEVERDGNIPLLIDVMEQVANWSNIDMDDIPAEGRFLISRANPEHEDRYLVNRLISEFIDFDFISLFIYNKPKFYAEYRGWSEGFREHVVKDISNTYMKDRRGLRNKLYR